MTTTQASIPNAPTAHAGTPSQTPSVSVASTVSAVASPWSQVNTTLASAAAAYNPAAYSSYPNMAPGSSWQPQTYPFGSSVQPAGMVNYTGYQTALPPTQSVPPLPSQSGSASKTIVIHNLTSIFHASKDYIGLLVYACLLDVTLHHRKQCFYSDTITGQITNLGHTLCRKWGNPDENTLFKFQHSMFVLHSQNNFVEPFFMETGKHSSETSLPYFRLAGHFLQNFVAY